MSLQPLLSRSPDLGEEIETLESCNARRRGPSLDKTAQTQRQITEAALAMFLEQGITGTTVAQIAQRAGVGKGTIYSYFPSKDAMLRGVVEHALANSLVYRPPVQRRPGESVQSLLRRSLLPTMESIEHSVRGRLAQLILSDSIRHPELAQLYKELAFDPWQQHVHRLLELAHAEGELVGDAVQDYARLLSSPFWMGMVHNGLLTSDPQQQVSIRPLMERLIALLFHRVELPDAADGIAEPDRAQRMHVLAPAALPATVHTSPPRAKRTSL